MSLDHDRAACRERRGGISPGDGKGQREIRRTEYGANARPAASAASLASATVPAEKTSGSPDTGWFEKLPLPSIHLPFT